MEVKVCTILALVKIWGETGKMCESMFQVQPHNWCPDWKIQHNFQR